VQIVRRIALPVLAPVHGNVAAPSLGVCGKPQQGEMPTVACFRLALSEVLVALEEFAMREMAA
jgi:hypothetical protein